jgi:putative transposase
MARAKRHYIPGQIWHLTHRCHKREFLLKFSKDRHRWLQWLYETRKRYDLTILDYTVTSNHIHLLVMDDGKRDVIPKSIQLVAGRTGQEYNQRKKRKGAFWEDRYHATAVENGKHLIRCLIYIDLNMVRTGVIAHPTQWSFSGYNEIQNPKRKNILIHYGKLRELLAIDSYDLLREYHRGWVEEYLNNGGNSRDDKWTKSIAVGSEGFIEKVKFLLGVMAKGRKSLKAAEGYQLRDPCAPYNAHFGIKNEDIGANNTYYWDINNEYSIG